MHPNIDPLKAGIQSIGTLIDQPNPKADLVYLMMQDDRFYAERQMLTIKAQLPSILETLDGIVTDLTEQHVQKDARIAELEAQLAARPATALELVPDHVESAYPDAAISGRDDIHKRPPLRDINSA